MSSNTIIDPARFGVSFSVKQCRYFGIETEPVLDWLINDMGFRRFRLMTYWNEVEKVQGIYDFTEVDKQIAAVVSAQGVISLCLGVKQPRYPEYHWPDWAWVLPKAERDAALLAFIEVVVKRCKSNANILSWQLENEALLTGFGERIDIDRKRLHAEYSLVKKLDPERPVVLSTSASWGFPIIGPIPDVVGFSYYLIRWRNTKYTTTYHYAWIHRLRAILIRLIWRKRSFIHELQMEPWGPMDIWQMEPAQQDDSMGIIQMEKNFARAIATRLYPIDLWGGEWWYQRSVKYRDPSTADTIRVAVKS